MATINNILGVIPAPVAAVLMLGGFIFYALGCIRLGYGAAVKPLVLDLIERAEQEIQGTKRGAERKAWVAQMLRMASAPANTADSSAGPSPMRPSVRSSSFSLTAQKRF